MKRCEKNTFEKLTPKGIIMDCVFIVVFAALAIVLYFLPGRLIPQSAVDYYAEHIFPFVAFPINNVTNIFMQSLTEFFAVAGILTIFIIILVVLYRLINAVVTRGVRRFIRRLLKVSKVLSVIALTGVIIFQLMIGLNYNRTPVVSKLGLTGQEHDYKEYLMTLDWAYRGMIEARSQLGVDYNGVAHMSTGFEETAYDANAIILGLDDYFGLDLSPNYVRTKPVMLSYLWSYTGIVGFYDAFLGEANINVDYMDILDFPVTVCHEIIHAKGYSREYDANTAAVIACIESPRADFRYAGFYYIFRTLYGTVRDFAIHEGEAIPDYVSNSEFDMVRADIEASYMYEESLDWNALTEFINSFSEDVNNTYLQSNGQDGGTETYHVAPNVYVNFYCTYVMEGSNA